MLNARGELIGINTAVHAAGQGLCFAIPSQAAEFVLSEVLSHGRVRRALLGVGAEDVLIPARAVRLHGLPAAKGVLVRSVRSGSPAGSAGLRPGDVLVSFRGKQTQTTSDLHRLLDAEAIDQEGELVFLRDGQRETVAYDRWSWYPVPPMVRLKIAPDLVPQAMQSKNITWPAALSLLLMGACGSPGDSQDQETVEPEAGMQQAADTAETTSETVLEQLEGEADLETAAAPVSSEPEAPESTPEGDREPAGDWKKVTRTEEEWRELLTPDQYRVARRAGTERAFTGEYWDAKIEGTYHCIGCDLELFASDTKFKSGTAGLLSSSPSRSPTWARFAM